MWTPDVYEGAPTPVTAFFAAAPKVAAMAVFVRATMTAFPTVTLQWQQIIVFVSIASMVLGSFAAIGQTNIKRLIAYSSIGHMGFALVGLAAGTQEGVQGVLIYVAIYVVMTLGTFACILSMKRQRAAWWRRSPISPVCHAPTPMMAFLLRDADVLARGHSAARRLLREILRLHCGDQCRPLRTRGHRRARERGRRLLLSADRQNHVFRRADRQASSQCGSSCAPCSRVAGRGDRDRLLRLSPLWSARPRRAKSF
jgi:hypothetical protein